MGSALSGFIEPSKSEARTSLEDVPESCVSLIMASLDPPDICRLAAVNRAFNSASSADFIWDSKLPSNYKFLVEQVIGESPGNLSKKDIYARLCRPNRFDAGTKEVWLDKFTGNNCMSISSKALKITGIDDRRYWNHLPTDESRFNTVAYLQQIWWVELAGETEFHFLPGTYSVFFRLQLGKPSRNKFGGRVCNLDQVHGWTKKPVRFELSTSTGQKAVSECYLNNPGNWNNYHAGDFYVNSADAPVRIKFSMVQIDCTHTKGGLCVDSVLIYPSEVRERSKQAEKVSCRYC